jgi:spermidine synthase
MGGMCLGSILLPRVVPARFHPLRVYAAIEVAIGVLGLLVLLLMPAIVSTPAAVALLLPPTLLMGATLPALARCVGEPSHLGFLYAVNIGGAVFGSLLAGFYLLRVFDVATATYAAAAINFGCCLSGTGFSLWGRTVTKPRPSEPRPSGSGNILLTIALSGFTALAAEALWTRILGLLFGASVYTLSIILAVFLTGLGIGSAIGSVLCRTLASPRRALGISQLLLAAAIAWTAYTITASLPYWPINPSISSNIWFNFELDLARALWAVLPPTLLWGASFPFALAATSASDKGEQMARVYAANTLGAIAGALLTSLFLVPQFGTQRAGQLLIAISTAAGLLLFLNRKIARMALAAAAAALCALLIHAVPPLSKLLVAYGRYAATWVGKSDIVYAGEGLNSSVAIASFPYGVLTFNVAGKVQASNVPRDMRLQRMLGHLTTLTVAEPRSILVIGCGAGITAGAVSIDPRVERETIVEIEPLVPRAASTYFSEPNFDVLHNPKVHLRLDDGRHYLLTTQDRFDGITVDPLDPWVKGAANLYTREFYEAMKRHLNPGGSVTMYIQLFETNVDAVKSALATFFEAFPNGTVWGNTYLGEGHDMILLGQVEPLHVDLDAMEQRFGYRDPTNKIPQSLAEVGMNSPEDLFANYAGRASDLTAWLRGAALNRDRNLRMQYLAGLGLNLDGASSIYSALIANRTFPADIFTSTEGRLDSLRLALHR